MVDELVIGGIWCLDSPARFSRGMVDLCLNDPWLSKENYFARSYDCWLSYQNTVEAIYQALADEDDSYATSKREISILVGPILSRILPLYLHASDLVTELLKQLADNEQIIMYCPSQPRRPKSSQVAVALCASDDLFTFVFHHLFFKKKAGERLVAVRRDAHYLSSYTVTSPLKARRRFKITVAKFFARMFRTKTLLVGSY